MKYFFAGSATSILLVLNNVYETERAKQMVRDETQVLRRMSTFELDQISKFRTQDHHRREEKLPALDS
jgi:hypothetical protein